MQLFPKTGKKKKVKIKHTSTKRERQKWIDATCRLSSKLVHKRDNYRCMWCGGSSSLGSHHIVAKGITRGNKMAYFDTDNQVLLCYNCHINKLKQMPDEYIEFRDSFLKGRGLNYKDMRIKYGTICKLHISDIKLIYADLKRQCVSEGIEL